MDDIKRQIEERKAQATKLRIFEKAVHAAYHLGEGHRDGQECHGREARMVYSAPDAGAGLTIDFVRTIHSDTNPSTTYETLEIVEGDETVFLRKGGTTEGYIPGDWEAELDKLQCLADRAKEDMAKLVEQKRQATESERAAALRKAWGLSSKDGRIRGGGEPKPRLGGVVERPPRRRRR